jgi:spore coat polysaccharide biosynthesis protein SpsF
VTDHSTTDCSILVQPDLLEQERMEVRNGKVALIMQARMGSTRLPGKSLMSLAGVPLVGRIFERARRAKRPHVFVMATTQRQDDDALMDVARAWGIEVFRGSETDLVDRYYQAATSVGADVIVRLPADNPVVEPAELDRIIDHYMNSSDDFSSNTHNILGNCYPDGLGAEVFSTEKLAEVNALTADPRNREHPHTYFYDHPERFRIGTVTCPKEFSRPDMVLDVNTKPQFDFIAEIYDRLYPQNPHFHITDIIRWYEEEYLPTRKSPPSWFHAR